MPALSMSLGYKQKMTSREIVDNSAEELKGLSLAEVKQRVQRGEVNTVQERTSRTYQEIFRANVFTLFNAILGTLLVLILIFGSVKDALFGLVIIFNSLIGIIQEIRAKRTLDRLALLGRPKVRVIREGQVQELSAEEIVLDDIIEIKTGDQIMVDGKIFVSEGLEIDESLLSGESVPVLKKQGDNVYSGCFAVAGIGLFKVTKIGAQTYAKQLTKEARVFALTRSELIYSINKFLGYIVWAMVIVAPFFFYTQLYSAGSIQTAASLTVAGLVGMVPQGLVLLTSIAFAASVIILGRRQVLIQELPAVEGLARVDVVCFDKTGTLTEDALVFHGLEKLYQQNNLEEVLQSFGSTSSASATMIALAKAFPAKGKLISKTVVPFSSERKWSALALDEDQTWILGAAEVLLGKTSTFQVLLSKVNAWAQSGFRVLLLGTTKEKVISSDVPDHFSPVALLIFEEQIREDTSKILDYFQQQDISLKVISGDNLKTVEAVCARAGLNNLGQTIDARYLPEDPEELSKIMEKSFIFGRVTPQQKQRMIQAMKIQGHIVAMVGDGVNDVLALKEANLGVAMGKSASATRAVAQVVLLDGKFSTLPILMAESRKITANIERVANLFLTKTVYITLLAIGVGIMFWPFPFLPRHLTLIDSLTIGIPAFFLALAPNTQRYRSGFVNRVLSFVIPAGFIAGAATFTVYAIMRAQILGNPSQITTAAFLALLLVGLWILTILSRPLNFWRMALLTMPALLVVGIISLTWTRHFFALEVPDPSILLMTVMVAGVYILVSQYVLRITGKYTFAKLK